MREVYGVGGGQAVSQLGFVAMNGGVEGLIFLIMNDGNGHVIGNFKGKNTVWPPLAGGATCYSLRGRGQMGGILLTLQPRFCVLAN
ncbi:hypothetical protein GCM10011375_22940 [Hymenobacter qilianensis]|uniref:Uncharacterized protein n=1 Tax=Hymenobacter qilianensis TaxID=1385715 RepID=A0ACB5PSA6_9BACT|nr:hypothetical protein GCM10011375_22940 [Hymenobacter qilianensis]